LIDCEGSETRVHSRGGQGWAARLVITLPPVSPFALDVTCLCRSYQYAQPGFWPPQFGVGHFADVQMIFRWFDSDTPREMIELSNTILSYWFVFVFTLVYYVLISVQA
jgi:hypothetical protein